MKREGWQSAGFVAEIWEYCDKGPLAKLAEQLDDASVRVTGEFGWASTGEHG